VFIHDFRLLDGMASAPVDVEVHLRKFIRCHPGCVPPPCSSRPADTFMVGIYPANSKVPRLKERNSDRVFHPDGLGLCFLRTGKFRGGVYYIPGTNADAKVQQPAVVRSLTKDEDIRLAYWQGFHITPCPQSR
jgi:hypothetical protein